MKKISPQSKSFIILVFIAVIGSFLCLRLWADLLDDQVVIVHATKPKTTQNKRVEITPVQPQIVNTSTWKTYTNKDLSLSFLYKPDWKILPIKTKAGFTVIQIDPGAKFFNIKIYISPKEFYLMDGLPTKTENIAGQEAYNVNNQLYGIKAHSLFYTFDIGQSLSLTPDFDALVNSVEFQ